MVFADNQATHVRNVGSSRVDTKRRFSFLVSSFIEIMTALSDSVSSVRKIHREHLTICRGRHHGITGLFFNR